MGLGALLSGLTGFARRRNRFRSTAFHNGLEIDGEEVNRFVSPDSLWQLRYDAHPIGGAVTCGSKTDTFRGSHDGYARLSQPVLHTRECVLDHDRPRFVVRDSLTGSGSHAFTWRFHLDPAITPAHDGANLRLSNGDRQAWVIPTQPAPAMTITIEDGWVSPSYGVRAPAKVIVCRATASLPLTVSFLFTLSPQP